MSALNMALYAQYRLYGSYRSCPTQDAAPKPTGGRGPPLLLALALSVLESLLDEILEATLIAAGNYLADSVNWGESFSKGFRATLWAWG